ncbi:acetolactate synthase large subunit [Thermobifida halotolerans]|uniref:Acetolactate synthase large subunit n=1 Tax=Thermobifida halotolerans TaxID=483545 RepID=A0AA97LZ84_9ACTN|nr:acetolactate synthase large subunit [Thermobifida halotolerans]UOE20578.1 acetolactate synthase large subunit [Thermobifida halotolerans]
MNGAQALIQTLVDSGVEVCFANPGTSEMHFVAALDHVPRMRGTLCLFEGVATGAADGYARMTDRPAAVLLHMGPGLGNGLANLHNARRADSPVVAVVGDHATHHKRLDAPLESDIDAMAGAVSGWVRRSLRSADVAADAAEAVAAAAAPPGRVATLILPADVSWSEGGRPAPPVGVRRPSPAPAETVESVAKALRSGDRCVLLLGGRALRRPALDAADRIARATGARLYAETFPARQERGAGVAAVPRLAYRGEQARAQLAGAEHLVLVGARSPVAFFAYPGESGDLRPEGCTVHVLAADGDDADGALADLADLVGARTGSAARPVRRPDRPGGALTVASLAAAVGALLPEDAVVVDESVTASAAMLAATGGAPPHDWLALTGGAIGQGMPLAVGAAVAAPGRRVVNLEADGSAMYTLSALWTQAREGLDVTTVVVNNGSYGILTEELRKVGAAASGTAARSLLDLGDPALDFVALARGMGVPAVRARTAEEFAAHFAAAVAEPGPRLVEAVVAPTPQVF